VSELKITIGSIEVSGFSSINTMITSAIYSKGKVIPGFAIAVNPEKVVAANFSQEVHSVISSATLRYPDGVGVSYVMGKKSGFKVARVPGCELWERLMHFSVDYQTPVFLIGSSDQVLKETCLKLRKLGVNIVGTHNGYFTNDDEVIDLVKEANAQIVSVALGSPKQELFINKCRAIHPNAFYMGVGGTYDVFTYNVKRAPAFFIKAHLEWLYRLLSQPSRILRQKSLIIYLYWFISGKL